MSRVRYQWKGFLLYFLTITLLFSKSTQFWSNKQNKNDIGGFCTKRKLRFCRPFRICRRNFLKKRLYLRLLLSGIGSSTNHLLTMDHSSPLNPMLPINIQKIKKTNAIYFIDTHKNSILLNQQNWVIFSSLKTAKKWSNPWHPQHQSLRKYVFFDAT